MATRVEKYIKIVPKGKSPSGVTNRWVVQNVRTNDLVGWIQWHGAWRRYCFFDAEASLYDSDCLRLIADFLDKAMLEHKANKSNGTL